MLENIIVLYIAEFFPRTLSRLLHQPFVERHGCPFLHCPLGKDRQKARAANSSKIAAQLELLKTAKMEEENSNNLEEAKGKKG